MFLGALILAVAPISNAEHAAVRIAADYLSRGSPAIEARVGPREGARWELQTMVPALRDRMAAFTVTYPSGLDDTVIFEMVNEGGAYKVRDIRSLAQPSLRKPLFAATVASAPTEIRNRKPLALALALFAAALTAAAAFLGTFRGLQLALLAAAAALVMTSTVQWSGGLLARRTETRRAESPPLHKPTNDVIKQIQFDLQQNHLDAAKRALAAFPSPSDIPLIEILRGRAALIDSDESGAALAFEHALNLGPGRDAIWLETADALMALGYDDRAAAYLERLARIGSRDADVYYSLAALAAKAGRADEAEAWLRQAWSLRPVERERILGADAFWSLLRRPSVASAISLSAATDPLVVSPDASTHPVVLPPGAHARTSGEFLEITIGEQQLLVPGGAALAPAGTPVVAATEFARNEEEQHLADLPRLLATGRNASAYAQPALRRRITATASALAAHNRWNDLVQLTDQLSASAEYVPPSIFFLRSTALQRMHRANDAKRVLADVAASRALQRKKDASALIELAELFAGHDLYDAAVRMYDRSQSIRPNAAIDERVRQIQMNKRLATKYYTTRTPHFEIHYPAEVSLATAAQLGEVLELELRRLQEWIPVADFKPVVVNVVWWQEFRGTYTQSDMILGFYNGKITVPLAGVELSPPIVDILGHELAHAMIAQATNDQAPRWFHEGLAQRVEQRPVRASGWKIELPVTLLDAVLLRSHDPEMITMAYDMALREVARYDRARVHAMLRAFRDGATTEEAIAR